MRRSFLGLYTALLFAIVLGAVGCTTEAPPATPDAAFATYVEAYTAGHISARGSIIVRIAEDQRWLDTAQVDLQRIFELEPAVEGTASWKDDRTLLFTPHQRLEQERTYNVRVALNKLIEVPTQLAELHFGFSTIRQGIRTTVTDLQNHSLEDLRWQRLVLTVRTSDDATDQDLEGCFSMEQDGRKLSGRWEHAKGGRQHTLLLDSVARLDNSSMVVVRWDGARLGSEDDAELSVAIPARNEIALITTSTSSEGERSATLLFSDPLDDGQDLTGIVGIAGVDDPRIQVDGNSVILYPRDALKGDHVAFVSGGLRDRAGRTLGRDLSVSLRFEELKPAVRMVGKGTILPSTDGMVMPFDAVNLHRVDVRIVRIRASNVAQFLQVNDLDGQRELARVGRLIARHSVPLRTVDAPDLGQWNRFHLNLSKYFKAEPGAIYRVELSFGLQHTLLPCAGEPSTTNAEQWERSWEEEQGQQDQLSEYWYYDDYGDYWGDEDADPCSEQYYRSAGSVARNLLASDLGIIAKQGNDRSLLLAVSDLLTTKPLSGVELEIQDLQRETLIKVMTDADGMANVPATAHAPFLVVASKGTQRGYLRLDPGAALSVSEFDVEGAMVARGLKGFIYGERGVWRPGDSLHLAFMLQDERQSLPKDHPVVMEITDPLGRTVDRMVRTRGLNGLYVFGTSTSADAPTGVWNARVKVGGAVFNRSLRIETVRPNRLKVELDARATQLLGSGPHTITLRSSWLHGAPARSLKSRVTMTLSAGKALFKGYERYLFDDLVRSVPETEQVVFDGQLNEQGQVEFPLTLNAGNSAPALVNANVVTRVFEGGGDASMDRMTIPCLPFNSYVGMRMPEPGSAWGSYVTDTSYAVPVVALTPQGKPIAGRKLTAQIYRLDHSWWWDGSMNGPANYISSPHARLRQEMALTTDAKGAAVLRFRIDRPEWGRFAVRISDPESGHVCASQVYVDWPGWEGRSRREDPSAAAMFTFNSDKDSYTVGEVATLILPSSGTGRALVSVETGSRVLQATWVELKDKETRYSFPITAEMAPNVYAHVTMVQPHEHTANDLPIRLYGVIPLVVTDPSTLLEPTITVAKEVRTDVPFTVEVGETTGRAMTYTLAIVDEGLLDLTRSKTPDPWNHFHAREALGVRTWDLYDQVIGAFGRQLQRVLALGGSDNAGPAQGMRANRFKPVVRYVGPFSLAKGAKGKHQFTIDNYVGSVRVMIVATNGTKGYGNAERTVPVRKPLMILASLPRQLSPGETVDLPVTVFAMDPKVKVVQVELAPDRAYTILGEPKRTVSFNAVGDQVAVFKVKARETVGIARFKVTATSGTERASTELELDVRQPNLPVVDVVEALIGPGEELTSKYSPLGTIGTNSAQVELSNIPPIDLGRRLQYLMDYPHGCLEQTTSKAFPQLYLARLVDLPGKSEELLLQNVGDAVRRIALFQRPDGGFNYWPGGDQYDAWSSVYVGHFLVEAQRNGHAVPQSLLGPWLSFQRKAAREWKDSNTSELPRGASQSTQAYRLYALALSRNAELGAMNRLRERSDLEPRARWLLAAGYAMAGRTDVAQELTRTAPTEVMPYTETGWTYGSDLRDEAIIAEALLAMGERTKAFAAVQRISRQLSSGQWHSTQSTAFALMAVSHTMLQDRTDRSMRFALTIDGKGGEQVSTKAIVQREVSAPGVAHDITVSNLGKSPLYLRVIRKGIPLAGEEMESASGILASVRYEDASGSTVDVGRVAQGEDLVAVVSVSHTGVLPDVQQLALTQVFPSGWEIRNIRMEGTDLSATGWQPSYQDLRDDRVQSYFDLPRGKSVTLRVPLNAAFTGRFYLPGINVEAMYDHTIRSRTKGQWVEVVPPGSKDVP